MGKNTLENAFIPIEEGRWAESGGKEYIRKCIPEVPSILIGGYYNCMVSKGKTCNKIANTLRV